MHGTGINPGGITERFPITLSALCRDIRHVRAEEFSDIRNYPTEMVVREIMLFGKDPETAKASPMLKVLGDGFMQSIDMIAAELGFALDAEKRARHEMAVATKPLDTPVGVIDAGTVAAQRFTWEGTVDGEPVITVRVNWLMGEADLDPPWTLGEQRFEVEFDADPPLAVTFHGLHPPVIGEHPEIGLTGPAMHCVNAIPYVVAAEPGIKTYLDLPIIAGRATAARTARLQRRIRHGERGRLDATVDLEDLAGDPRRGRRREVDDGRRDVLRCTDATHRRVVLELPARVGIGEHLRERVGLDATDFDRVDPYLRRELGCERPRHHRERGFRGRVRDEHRLHHARRRATRC